MKYLKYFESHSLTKDYYTRLPYLTVDAILFDEFLNITENSIPFDEDEIKAIISKFDSLDFLNRPNICDYKIKTKTRRELSDLEWIENESDIVQISIRIKIDIEPYNSEYDNTDELVMTIYKKSDEWYYVATYGGNGDYKCDQIEGLFKFFESLPSESNLLKEERNISESQTEVSIKERLQSIVDMCDYLWSIGAADSLEGFYGKCSSLFTGCLDVNQGWSRGGRKPYEFNVDCLVNKLETSDYRREEKMKLIEILYQLSKAKRANNTKSDVRNLLQPILDYEIFGGKVLDNIEINQYYNFRRQPVFSIEFSINEDELSCDKSQIKDLYRDFHEHGSMYAKEKLKEIEKEFRRIKNILEIEFKKINFSSHGLEIENTFDYSQLGHLNNFTIHLKEV